MRSLFTEKYSWIELKKRIYIIRLNYYWSELVQSYKQTMMCISRKWCLLVLDIFVNGFSNAHITSYIDNFTSYSLEMKDALRVATCWNDNFYIFWKSFRKPECNISLLCCFLVCKSIDGFNDNNNFMIDFLRAVNNLLFFDLWADDIKPISKELPNIFLKKIDILFEF